MASFKSYLSEFREMRRFQKLDRAKRNIVVYSESGSYWGYLEPFVDQLIEEYGKSVCYLTSSPRDPVLIGGNPAIRPFYIGSGSIRTILFASLDADVVVMTTPDLDSYSLKRSKYPVHYVFIPHNMTSTHMVFRKGAFDAFDTFFCVGPHHVAELREGEQIYGLKPRSLVEVGYAKLDALLGVARASVPPLPSGRQRILISPSWPPHSLLEVCGEDLIASLVTAGHEVVVRPHRDTEKLAGKSLRALRARFDAANNFTLADGKAAARAFDEADLLITDWSGSALSFAFARERPVLFMDIPRKALNPDYERFTNQPLEVTIRERIGAILSPDCAADAPDLIARLHNDRDRIAAAIRDQRALWIFNLGSSAKVGAAHLAQLAEAVGDQAGHSAVR